MYKQLFLRRAKEGIMENWKLDEKLKSTVFHVKGWNGASSKNSGVDEIKGEEIVVNQ